MLTPYAALFALSGVVPLAVVLERGRRHREIRRALGLAEAPLRSQLRLVVALAAIPALLGLAATQPVLSTERTVRERLDAQVFVVLDVSRSMLAAEKPGDPTRFERARAVALRLREQLPEVPFGLASLTDRVLPHLFPTSDGAVFAATLERSLGIERPPPGAFYLTVATSLNALRVLPEKRYFPPSARRRVVLVLTDGETEPPLADLATRFRRGPRIETIFVRFWGAGERIYETGVAEDGYRPDPRSAALLARAAALGGGRVYEEGEVEAAAQALRRAVGEGETAKRRLGSARLPLMPYLTLAALLPLAFVLLDRNRWWESPLARRRRRRDHRATAAKVSPVRGVAQPG